MNSIPGLWKSLLPHYPVSEGTLIPNVLFISKVISQSNKSRKKLPRKVTWENVARYSPDKFWLMMYHGFHCIIFLLQLTEASAIASSAKLTVVMLMNVEECPMVSWKSVRLLLKDSEWNWRTLMAKGEICYRNCKFLSLQQHHHTNTWYLSIYKEA